jgi:hypothetical protein
MSATRSFAGWEASSKGRNGFEFWVLGFEFCVGARGLSSSCLLPIIYAETSKNGKRLKTQNASAKPKTQNSKLISPGALYIRASCLENLCGHVAFRFCMLRLKPREVADEIVKNEDLSVAFGTGTYADCGYRDSASDLSGYGGVD